MSQAGAGQFTIANTGDKYNIRRGPRRPRLVAARRKGRDRVLAAATGQAKKTIVHLGSDKLLAQDGTVATFSHDSVGTIFTYELEVPPGRRTSALVETAASFSGRRCVRVARRVHALADHTADRGRRSQRRARSSALSAIEIEFGVRAYPKTNFA